MDTVKQMVASNSGKPNEKSETIMFLFAADNAITNTKIEILSKY